MKATAIVVWAAAEQEKDGAIEQVKPPYLTEMAPNEQGAGRDSAECAATVFDDDPDPRVVEDHVEEDQQAAEQQVTGDPPQERRPLRRRRATPRHYRRAVTPRSDRFCGGELAAC